MKKLMIVAAVAAMVGAVQAATDCTRPTTPTNPGADVYQLKMSLKTTTGVGDVATTAAAGSLCSRTPGSSSTNVYRKATTLAVDGWIYMCTNLCTTLKNGTVVAWETKNKTQFTGPTIAWQDNFPQVMGPKNADAEAYFKFTGTIVPGKYAYNTQAFFNITELWCAGQGKYDVKNARFTQLSGNCAGKGTAPYDVSRTAKSCDPSKVLQCTAVISSTTIPTDANPTAIFGTWSIRYNAAASRNYLTKGTLSVPKYVTL